MSERTDTERLEALGRKMQGGWMLNLTINPYTGTFLARFRSRGFCNGKERWEEQRLGQGPRGKDWRYAIDNMLEAEENADRQQAP